MTSESFTMELEARPQSIQRARRFVRDRIDGRVNAERADVVELLTSELVTNAIVHTGTRLELCVQVDDGHVRVEVSDRSDTRPQLRHEEDPLAVSGRGLQFVDQLATAWGVAPKREGPGKQVWFEVH